MVIILSIVNFLRAIVAPVGSLEHDRSTIRVWGKSICLHFVFVLSSLPSLANAKERYVSHCTNRWSGVGCCEGLPMYLLWDVDAGVLLHSSNYYNEFHMQVV